MSGKTIENLDLLAASGGLFVGLFIFYLSLSSGIHQYDIGSTIFLASLIYLILRNRLLNASEIFCIQRKKNFLYFNNILFFLSFSLSLWLLHSILYFRPLIYFLLVTLSCISIVLEILYTDKSWTGVLLIKILLIGIALTGGIYYEFDSIVGIDTWYHNGQTQIYIENAHLTWDFPPFSSRNSYYSFPIFHILSAATSILTSLNIYDSIFVSTSFPLIFSAVFVFIISQKLINRNIGLLAMLLLTVSEYHLFFQVNAIPMSLGIVFFTMILYLLLSKKYDAGEYRSLGLLLFFVITMTHTIAAFISLISVLFLFIGGKLSNLYAKNKKNLYSVTSMTVFAFALILVYYWTIAFVSLSPSWTFFEQAVGSLVRSLTNDAQFSASEHVSAYSESEYSYFEYTLDHLGYLIFLGFGIIGTYIWLRNKDHNFKLPLVLTMVVLFVILYGFALFGMRTLLPTRWFAFIYVILAIVSAFGIIKFINTGSNESIKIVSLMIITGLICFFMITSTITNSDSPLYAEKKADLKAFTNSEISAAKWTEEKYDKNIVTDSYYEIFELYHFISTRNATFLDPSKEQNFTHLVILRTNPKYMYTESIGFPFSVSDFNKKLDNSIYYSSVYTNGKVVSYYRG